MRHTPDYRKDMRGFIESKIFGFEISKKSYKFFRSLNNVSSAVENEKELSKSRSS
ncbi:hypothetical protein LEP1GSC051_0059 [Leptospira sp. P2653]|nr:hypothetical protein LEP1GSC051_0059 [Leptospira sp. P2653]